MGWVKNMIKKWLGIETPNNSKTLELKKGYDFEQSVMRNRLWYLGDPQLLSQFYKTVGEDSTNTSRFWAVTPVGEENFVRKIHSDIPARAVDKLCEIVLDDLESVSFLDEGGKEIDGGNPDWDEIEKDNSVSDILKDMLVDEMTIGDGAFKLIVDTTVTKYPIIQWVSGDRIDYTYKYGRLYEVVFYTNYIKERNRYQLKEIYSAGKIEYKLFNEGGKEVPLSSIPETADFKAVVFNTTKIFALPVLLKKSKVFKGRGASLFEGKSDLFDALDESLSQWVDALRAGRTQQYIPEYFAPKDSTGQLLKPNPMTSRYAVTESPPVQGLTYKIESTQALIPSQDYLTTHISILDSCLQGIISPSTLGIDVKKLDNAEAQREKEKTTLYTRGQLIGLLQKCIPKLIDLTLSLYALINGQTSGDYFCKLEFGEYASPSFEAVIETMNKAAPGKQLISYELMVDEIWGKDKTEEEKKAEVARLQALNNPAPVNSFLPSFDLGTLTGGGEVKLPGEEQ